MISFSVRYTFSGKLLKLLPPYRCQILRPKCTEWFVGWGSAPDPAELTALSRTPSWILGDLLLREETERKGKGEEGMGWDGMGD